MTYVRKGWIKCYYKRDSVILLFRICFEGLVKFTNSFSYNEIPFLDVNVLLINGRLETDFYVKPTDKHQYLLKSSCHPSHTKQSISFSMALRLRRICSSDEFFNTRSNALTTHLIKRGYQHRFLKEEMEKVRQIPRSKALETYTKQVNNRIPFVVTFNPALPNIRQIIFNNLNILRSSQRCKAAFPSPPLVSYRRCNNLRDILVRATHRRPPPKHLELSAVTEVGAKHVLSLQREPRFTPSSPLTNKGKFYITSLAHLPISSI